MPTRRRSEEENGEESPAEMDRQEGNFNPGATGSRQWEEDVGGTEEREENEQDEGSDEES